MAFDFDYDSMRETAVEMVEEFGQPVLLTKSSAGTYDPSTGDVTGAGASTFNCAGVEIPHDESFIDGKKYEYDDQYKGGTTVKLFDAKLYLSPKTVEGDIVTPALGDAVTLQDGRKYSVIDASPIQPSGLVVLWMLGLRA